MSETLKANYCIGHTSDSSSSSKTDFMSKFWPDAASSLSNCFESLNLAEFGGLIPSDARPPGLTLSDVSDLRWIGLCWKIVVPWFWNTASICVMSVVVLALIPFCCTY